MKRFRKGLIALLAAALFLAQATSAFAGDGRHKDHPRWFPGDPGDPAPLTFPGDPGDLAPLNFPGDPGDGPILNFPGDPGDE